MRPSSRRWAILAAGAALSVGILAASVGPVPDLRAGVEAAGPWAPAILFAAFVLSALLCLPGSGLTIACGAILGFFWGTVVASLGTLTSAAISLALTRTVLATRVERWLTLRPRLLSVYRAVQDGGWRLVGMMRLSPALPLGPSNWIFGLARVRPAPYLAVTWLATLPSKLMWVHLGVTGRESIAMIEDPSSANPEEVAVLILGLLGTVGAVVFLGRLARRRLREALPPPPSASGS